MSILASCCFSASGHLVLRRGDGGVGGAVIGDCLCKAVFQSIYSMEASQCKTNNSRDLHPHASGTPLALPDEGKRGGCSSVHTFWTKLNRRDSNCLPR